MFCWMRTGVRLLSGNREFRYRSLVSGRNDIKWDILRDDSVLASKVGDFIELPNLPGDKPKLFISQNWERFLLTEQRYKILCEVLDAVDKGPLKERARNGLCLSGPQGSGKSALNYLIASVAFARGYYLQYMPLCGEWAEARTDDLRAQYFVQQFRDLNKDLDISFLHNETKEASVLSTHLSLQDNLLYHLKSTTERPALIILDEHNELYRLRRDPRSGTNFQYKTENYFGSWTKWTSITGPRIYIIYAGSAHSEFESNLPSGEDSKLRHLRPFSKAEAIKLIEELKIQEKFGGQYSSEEIFENLTGGLPREISRLAASDIPAITWQGTIIGKCFEEIKGTCNNLSLEDKADFINFLGAVLCGKPQRTPPSLWYDKGMFYKTELGEIEIVGPNARTALWEYYSRSQGVMDVNQPGQTGSETGAKLEVAVKAGLISSSHTFQPFEIGATTVLAPLTFPKVDRIVPISIPKKPVERGGERCWLWVGNQNHKSFEWILQSFVDQKIYFIQSSINTPQDHKTGDRLKVLKAFDPEKDGTNQMEKELGLVTGEEGWKVTYDQEIMKAAHPTSEWSVRFLFITTASESDCKKRPYPIKNMMVVTQEQLMNLGVKWRKT